MTATIVWFRLDLRLADNPALQAALARGGPLIPVFIWSPEEEAPWEPGAASRWWLHQSLAALDEDLRTRGSRLVLRRGPASAELPQLALESGADAVYWNRRYEPAVIARDRSVKEGLRAAGLAAESFSAGLLFEPWEVRTRQGRSFQVFTPFWRACQALPAPPEPTPPPRTLPPVADTLGGLPLAALALEPARDWAAGLRAAWQPGAAGAARQLRRFVAESVAEYAAQRDQPARAATSRLSPHLHFGELSPRAVWHAVAPGRAGESRRARGADGPTAYLREIGWREFAYHLLYHFPHTTDQPLRAEFARFPWRRAAAELRAWQRGRTGYPIVDAGLRELWATGWMHNRVRMIVASFLVKDLLLSWQSGARWFWDTLVDADLASNTLGWQWTAGCGADAAPHFRVFNPVLQGEKFDPAGAYVRRWVPELARLPERWVHAPWSAPADELHAAGVVLGQTYPRPLVEHAAARLRALAAMRQARASHV